MQSNEFKSKMVLLDLTQAKIAYQFDVSERTIARWLNETKIPKIAELALFALEQKSGKL